MVLSTLRVLVEVLGERRVHERIDNPLDTAVPEAHLGLAFELGVRHLDRDDGGQALPHIFAPEGNLGILLDETVPLRNDVDAPGDGAAEAFEVGAAFPGIDRVDVRVEFLIVLRSCTAARPRVRACSPGPFS